MTSAPSNHDIANLMYTIADTMEIMGEDRFRYQAYRRAGDAIQELPATLSSYRERGELETLPGVGKAIAAKIGELLDTGKLVFYERLQEKIPATVLEMLRVPGVGPRTVGRLYRELGIDSLTALKKAAEEGTLNNVKGFGNKTVEGILQGIAVAEQLDRRTLLSEALKSAEAIISSLHQVLPSIQHISYAGSLRRARQTIGDLDILAAADDPTAVVQVFINLPNVTQVVSSGNEKATVYLHSGLQADLIALKPAMWGSALLHFTGSQAHNIRFRELALARGLSFSEHGFKRADGTMRTCATEEEAYAAINLPWIPPELREDAGEFEAARNGTLPTLLDIADIKADLHMHSTWSDGKASIREMAETAKGLGHHFIVITDHSAYLGITNGLDTARLRQQALEIAEINAELEARGESFRVLRGIEVDITPDGALALPDKVLADLDVVVASPHANLRQPPEKATERLLRAIRNPHVDIIGHPTGRLIGEREGADIDINVIGRAAADTGTFLEVNSGPDRLDLDALSVHHVLDLGATIVVNSDAHHPDHLQWIRLGALTARRGWASSERVANTWGYDRLMEWVRRNDTQVGK
ncbi:MAG: DNA polymerase/3'-5' exonuclease PolX [Chloroflexota bacterium]